LGPDGWDIVDYNEKYYYSNLVHKLDESLSVSNCTMTTSGPKNKLPRRIAPGSRDDADLEIEILPPPADILEEWRRLKSSLSESPRHHATARQFVQVDPNLCACEEFKHYLKGFFKRAKGCYKMFITDPKSGLRKKRINTYGATLHPDHSRCNVDAAANLCKHALAGEKAMDYPWEIESETPIANTAFPFMIKAKDVIVAKSGMFALPCGPFGLYSSCEACNWGLPAARLHVQNVTDCRAGKKCKVPTFDKVFVGSQYDDTQIGQFMTEDLPKIVYNLDFIRANPDMKIHFGFTKKDVLPTFVLPHNIFEWLGLKDRIINGSYYAKEAYMPREGGCQEPGYAMWEIYTMRKVFMEMARKEIGVMGRNHTQGWGYPTYSMPDPSFGPMDFYQSEEDSHKPVVLLVKRSSSRFTQNQGDFKERRWPPEFGGAGGVRDALARVFPHHRIQIFSDLDKDMMMCMACQAQVFNSAEVVVGVHGAGLTNAVFMNPGGILVEAVPRYDSRHAPITGIFARLAGMNGLSHFSYYLRKEFHPDRLANHTREFYDHVRNGQPRIMPLAHAGGSHDPADVSAN
jgi:hypothetical protein